MAVFALGVVVAPVLGPTLGGWLTDQYSWRWAFYINIPIGVLAIFMISRFVTDPPYIKNAKPGRIDGIGLGLLAVWLGACRSFSIKARKTTGSAPPGFAGPRSSWHRYVRRLSRPRVRSRQSRWSICRSFDDRNFALGCLLIGLFGGVIYGVVTLLPLFYQTLLGYTAGAAGWAVSPRGIGAICIMPVIGVLTGRIDNRWLIMAASSSSGSPASGWRI